MRQTIDITLHEVKDGMASFAASLGMEGGDVITVTYDDGQPDEQQSDAEGEADQKEGE